MKMSLVAIGAVSLVLSSAASADERYVTNVSGLPSATTWGTLPGENLGGGTANVTTTSPRSGGASLEMVGDRTRTQLGIQYSGVFQTNLGSLADYTGLTFDWRIAGNSTNPYNLDYTPALRLLINNAAGTRQELIWEGVYNGTYGKTMRDTWYSSGIDDKFYITGGNVNDGHSIAYWASNLTGATVTGFSVGVGSGATTGYHAFADNVTASTRAGSTTYNFELATPAVPEPATWGMMIVGFGLAGASLRALRRDAKVSFG